jgi:DNA polymerase-3 subunit gamma/tau
VADLPAPEDLVKRLKDATPPQGARVAARGGPNGAPSAKRDAAPSLAAYASFKDVLALIKSRRDLHLLVEVEKHVRLVSYQPGRIEFAPAADMPAEFPARFAARLQNWTGARWVISLAAQGGESTIEEMKDAQKASLQEEAMAHPLVAAVFEVFSGAEILNVEVDQGIADLNEGIVPIDPDELDDDWEPFDPFEEQA